MSAFSFSPDAPLALIGAMPEEVAPLLDAGSVWQEVKQGPQRWHEGALDGVPVLLAVCGVGKVNAAALTQALLARGASAVVFTGVAGGVDASLRVGDLVVSRDAVQHDVDVTALGYEPGQVPGATTVFAADAALRARVLAAAQAVAASEGVRVLEGRVASGDAFVADPVRVKALRERFAAACAEMEGAAVAQVCAAWGVPWVVVRSISDTADHDANVDFRAFTEVAARRAVRVVRTLLQGFSRT